MKKFIVLTLFSLLFTVELFAAAGKLIALRGEVTVKRDTTDIPATLGMDLEEKDQIFTGADGRVQVRFEDDTTITIGKSSDFKIDEYIASDTAPSAQFSMGVGTFRAITGKIGKIAPDRFKITTKSASIGIRGTQFFVQSIGDETGVATTENIVVLTSLETGETIEVPAGLFAQVLGDGSITEPIEISDEQLEQLQGDTGTSDDGGLVTEEEESSTTNEEDEEDDGSGTNEEEEEDDGSGTTNEDEEDEGSTTTNDDEEDDGSTTTTTEEEDEGTTTGGTSEEDDGTSGTTTSEDDGTTTTTTSEDEGTTTGGTTSDTGTDTTTTSGTQGETPVTDGTPTVTDDTPSVDEPNVEEPTVEEPVVEEPVVNVEVDVTDITSNVDDTVNNAEEQVTNEETSDASTGESSSSTSTDDDSINSVVIDGVDVPAPSNAASFEELGFLDLDSPLKYGYWLDSSSQRIETHIQGTLTPESSIILNNIDSAVSYYSSSSSGTVFGNIDGTEFNNGELSITIDFADSNPVSGSLDIPDVSGTYSGWQFLIGQNVSGTSSSADTSGFSTNDITGNSSPLIVDTTQSSIEGKFYGGILQATDAPEAIGGDFKIVTDQGTAEGSFASGAGL